MKYKKPVGYVWIVKTHYAITAFDTLDSALNYCYGKYDTPQNMTGWERHNGFCNGYLYCANNKEILLIGKVVNKVDKDYYKAYC